MRPDTLAEVARRSASDADWEHHLREFLDAFYGRDGDPVGQAAMVADEPALLGEARLDAFLGGAGEHLARRWRLPVAGWVGADERYLREAWFVPDRPGLRGYLLAASPVAFRNRLIFTGPDPLQRARFPYRRGVVDFPAASPDNISPADPAADPVTGRDARALPPASSRAGPLR